jgi:hypothetical protein
MGTHITWGVLGYEVMMAVIDMLLFAEDQVLL